MVISDGQPVNAAASNAAWMSRTANTTAAGTITQTNTTQSTTKDTGAIVTDGGVGIEKNLNVGGNVAAAGTVTGSNLSGTNTGDVTLTAVGSAPSDDGASLSGQALTLQPADATHPGVISTGGQDIAGAKTFIDDVQMDGSLAVTGDVDITGGLSVAGALAPMTALGDTLYGGASPAGVATRLAGNTTTTRKFLKQDGTGTDANAPAWATLEAGDIPSGVGGLAVSGTRASPTAITAGGGITADSVLRSLQFIQGSGGAVDITANPQISAGTTVGQEVVLIGRSDTNTVTLDDGTGLSLNGSCILDADNAIGLFWDGTNWSELWRRK